MRRLFPLLLLVLAAAVLAGAALGDDIRAVTVHGRVTAWSPAAGVTVRSDDGSSVSCDFHRGQADVTQFLLEHIAPGQAVTLICFSGDGGATWEFGRIVQDDGTPVSVVGAVTRITPSSIEVTPDRGQWFRCVYDRTLAAKIVPLGVGRRVKLTCSLGRLVDVAPARGKSLATLTVTGTYLDMTPSEGLIVYRQDPVTHSFFLRVPNTQLASVEALGLNEGDQITVTVRARGKNWVVTSVARAG